MWGRSVHSRLPRRFLHKAELDLHPIVFLTLEICNNNSIIVIVITPHPQILLVPKDKAEIRVLKLCTKEVDVSLPDNRYNECNDMYLVRFEY